MPVLINAEVQGGKRKLQVLDAHSGHIRLAWQAADTSSDSEADLHALFRQLMLLSEIDPAQAD